HGRGGTQNSGSNYSIPAWEVGIESGELEPTILVKPNGWVSPFEGSFYINSDYYGNYEDYISTDLVAYIDSAYNTIADKKYRALSGYSMGGYGAMFHALKYPEQFSAVSTHSGAGYCFNWMEDYIDDEVMPENEGSLNPNAGPYTGILFNFAAVFTPNPNNPPYYLDLVCDNSGEINDSVFTIWQEYSISSFATEIDPDIDLDIHFTVGNQPLLDHLLVRGNQAFSDTLDSLGIHHDFEIYDCSHGGANGFLYERHVIGFSFLDSVMWYEVPRAFNTSAVPGYITPGSGEVHIQTDVSNPLDYEVNAYALFRIAGQSITDSTGLFDDGAHGDSSAGDGIWGGSWAVPEGETNWQVDVQTVNVDLSESFIRHKAATFTSIGPISFQNLSFSGDSTVYPGDNPMLFLEVVNESDSITVNDVTINIWLDDETYVNPIGTAERLYGTIAAGDAVTNSFYYWLNVHADCPFDTSFTINLTISSDGVEYWGDSFQLYIQPDTTVGISENGISNPEEYSIHQNYPNPFNPTTTIQYTLPEESSVKLTVYDIRGQEVTTLEQTDKPPGNYEVQWNGSDDSGIQVNTGVYFARLETGDYSQAIKMVFLK
ncbi:MAG: T9SS type A sorting domain-containing protein, partial [Candidatus Marinimicrobia bacterium]|nr:T9SS type A sorting domain-containing protein [Candidatus Neomarinimicrobiota bacterium]MBT5313880.1 T9SS type A sorting domain-containing protein [Candidatus Neomarinimicrobiota bacterium]MBT7580368.1 T9SS type A sorting domain-containing protein [Candidatus Neomarinimicrobiota bacterium]